MKIVNFGSLNIDFVYSVEHIVRPGETISSNRLDVFCGGKGLNQSIALARAGASVHHAGMVGADGDMLIDMCRENGVDVSNIRRVAERSGNAIIQVDANGQNCIVLFGGANRKNDEAFCTAVLEQFSAGDVLLLQNEINLIGHLIDAAAAKGMYVALNPSPYNGVIDGCNLGNISLFLINEIEGEQLTGETAADKILDAMLLRYPKAETVLTLGRDGAIYQKEDRRIAMPIHKVEVVDTTAAGDTFAGYFLAAVMEGMDPETALKRASRAAGIAVSRAGAAPSIPERSEVDALERVE